MSSRDRWIVYPLLFLSLGMAWREKFVRPMKITADQIQCEQLEVVGDDNYVRARLGMLRDDGPGELLLCNREGQEAFRVTFDAKKRMVLIETPLSGKPVPPAAPPETEKKK